MVNENIFRRKSWYLVAMIAYMVIVFLFSSTPQKSIPSLSLWSFTVSSTVKHIGEYFILSLLIFLWLINTERFKPVYFHVFLITVVVSSIYGITDELHQTLVPTRYGTVPDMLSNFFGSILIAPLVALHAQKNKNKKSDMKRS